VPARPVSTRGALVGKSRGPNASSIPATITVAMVVLMLLYFAARRRTAFAIRKLIDTAKTKSV
jgi:uncharacterized protein (TIGR03382 family)